MTQDNVSLNSIDLERLWKAVVASIPWISALFMAQDSGDRLGRPLDRPRSGADGVIVQLFALFHDSRRENTGVDPGYGTRGTELAR